MSKLVKLLIRPFITKFDKIYKTEYGETFFINGSSQPVKYSSRPDPLCEHTFELVGCTTGGGWMAIDDLIYICTKCGKLKKYI